MGRVSETVVSAQEWANELFGDDADEIRTKAEQIIAEDGVALHLTMVVPMASAREWLDAYQNSLHAIPEAVASMLMFLESVAKQIEQGIDMEVGDSNIDMYFDDDEDDY